MLFEGNETEQADLGYQPNSCQVAQPGQSAQQNVGPELTSTDWLMKRPSWVPLLGKSL